MITGSPFCKKEEDPPGSCMLLKKNCFFEYDLMKKLTPVIFVILQK